MPVAQIILTARLCDQTRKIGQIW